MENQPPDKLPITNEEQREATREFNEISPDRRARFYGRRQVDKRKEIDRRWIIAALVILGIGVSSSQYYITNKSKDIQANQDNIANIVIATNIWGCAIVTAPNPEARRMFLGQYGTISPKELPKICQTIAFRSAALANRALEGKNITGQVQIP